MRISYFYIVSTLLLGSSMISAKPPNALSNRGGKPDFVVPSRMEVKCKQRIYTSKDLDTAAKEVCNRVKGQTHCRDYISCYYIKKVIPAIPKVDVYSGEHFVVDSENEKSLYKWPLPKRSFFEGTAYYAVVSMDPNAEKCHTMGAVISTDGRKYEQCSILRKHKAVS